MKLYCDESGYTGSDLLNNNQPFFVYSGVLINDITVDEILAYIRNNYNIQKGEIKGKKLLSSPKGKSVIQYIFENYSKNVRIVFHDKTYTLAAKIIEFGIEPYLHSNTQFYKSRYNVYLAYGLYLNFITKQKSSIELFNELLSILRGNKLITELKLDQIQYNNKIDELILEVILSNTKIIEKEMFNKSGKVEKWILELSTTSLHSILSEFAKTNNELEVICDNSDVFNNNIVYDSLNEMGLKGVKYSFLNTSIGFKLKGKITNADSSKVNGLQIADIFSSTVFNCLKNPRDIFSKTILDIVSKNCRCLPNDSCIMPNVNHTKLLLENINTYSQIEDELRSKFRSKTHTL